MRPGAWQPVTGMTMTWIAPAYLRVLMDRAAANPEPPDDPELANEALQYAAKALDGTVPGPEPVQPEPPALPDGRWGTVELPGHRNDTGWIADEARYGGQGAVVRDWDGREIAVYFPGSGSRVVLEPTPLKRPEPQTALPAGAGFRSAESQPGDPWCPQPCICGPDSTGEAPDERPDCPVHGAPF